jgi:hypothetical protein
MIRSTPPTGLASAASLLLLRVALVSEFACEQALYQQKTPARPGFEDHHFRNDGSGTGMLDQRSR